MELRKGDKLIKNSHSNISLDKILELSENIYFMCVSIHRALPIIEHNKPLEPPQHPKNTWLKI